MMTNVIIYNIPRIYNGYNVDLFESRELLPSLINNAILFILGHTRYVSELFGKVFEELEMLKRRHGEEVKIKSEFINQLPMKTVDAFRILTKKLEEDKSAVIELVS